MITYVAFLNAPASVRWEIIGRGRNATELWLIVQRFWTGFGNESNVYLSKTDSLMLRSWSCCMIWIWFLRGSCQCVGVFF